MNNSITIGGRELRLVWDVAAWVDVEKIFGSLDRMYKNFDEDTLPIVTGLHLAAITATSGTCDREQKESITFAWLVKNTPPEKVQELTHMARMAIVEGMQHTETLFDDKDAIDPVLEEIEAKKTRADA